MILSQEQEKIRDAVRAFAQAELWPHAARWNKERHFPVERIYRDVRVCQIYEGTSDVQKIIIQRALA